MTYLYIFHHFFSYIFLKHNRVNINKDLHIGNIHELAIIAVTNYNLKNLRKINQIDIHPNKLQYYFIIKIFCFCFTIQQDVTCGSTRY